MAIRLHANRSRSSPSPSRAAFASYAVSRPLSSLRRSSRPCASSSSSRAACSAAPIRCRSERSASGSGAVMDWSSARRSGSASPRSGKEPANTFATAWARISVARALASRNSSRLRAVVARASGQFDCIAASSASSADCCSTPSAMAVVRFSTSRVVRESGSVAEICNSSAISCGPAVPAASSRFCIGASFSATSELIRSTASRNSTTAGYAPRIRSAVSASPDVLDLLSDTADLTLRQRDWLPRHLEWPSAEQLRQLGAVVVVRLRSAPPHHARRVQNRRHPPQVLPQLRE